jgi:hypothetical protein
MALSDVKTLLVTTALATPLAGKADAAALDAEIAAREDLADRVADTESGIAGLETSKASVAALAAETAARESLGVNVNARVDAEIAAREDLGDRVAQAETDIGLKFDKAGGEITGDVDLSDNDLTTAIPEPEGRASGFAWAVKDEDGKRLGVRKSGWWTGKGIDALPDRPARASRHAAPVYDGIGRVIASVLRSGWLWARGLEVPVVKSPSGRATRQLTGIVSEDPRGSRKLLLGFQSDGRMIGRMSRVSLDTLSDDLTATSWRGTDQVAFVRQGATALRGIMTDGDGVAYDALQARGGYRLNSAVADGTGVDLILRVGQSNAGGGSGTAGPAALRKVRYPRHVIGLSNIYGGAGVDWYGATTGEGGPAPIYQNIDFASAVHTAGYGLSPTICTATGVVALARAKGQRVNPQACVTSWRGGTDAAQFEPGDPYFLYENLIEGAKRARQAAGWYGLPIATPRIVWTQGENGPFTGYAALFGTLIDSYRTGIQSALGLASPPPFYFNQINQAADDVATGVELDQRQVAIDRAGTGVTCVGPMYQFPLLEQVGINIHTSDLGRTMQGELEALVFSLPGFKAVGQSVTATRSGAVVTLTYADLPADGQLRVDADWIATVAALGFKVTRQSNGSSVAINSAVVSGTNQIVITLATDPGGIVRVDYARDTDNPQALWAGGRGLVYVDSGVASPIAGANGAPSTIRHYALRMRVNTTS